MKFCCQHGACLIRPYKDSDTEYGIAFTKPNGNPCCVIKAAGMFKSDTEARSYIQGSLSVFQSIDWTDLPRTIEFMAPFELESKDGKKLGMYLPTKMFNWFRTSQGILCTSDETGPLGYWNGESWQSA